MVWIIVLWEQGKVSAICKVMNFDVDTINDINLLCNQFLMLYSFSLIFITALWWVKPHLFYIGHRSNHTSKYLLLIAIFWVIHSNVECYANISRCDTQGRSEISDIIVFIPKIGDRNVLMNVFVFGNGIFLWNCNIISLNHLREEVSRSLEKWVLIHMNSIFLNY